MLLGAVLALLLAAMAFAAPRASLSDKGQMLDERGRTYRLTITVTEDQTQVKARGQSVVAVRPASSLDVNTITTRRRNHE